jgi:hypothetical protein
MMLQSHRPTYFMHPGSRVSHLFAPLIPARRQSVSAQAWKMIIRSLQGLVSGQAWRMMPQCARPAYFNSRGSDTRGAAHDPGSQYWCPRHPATTSIAKHLLKDYSVRGRLAPD